MENTISPKTPMKLAITHHDDDTTTIEGTRYSNIFFRELGCSFPESVGQILRIEKKEHGVVTVTRLHDLEEKKS